MLHRLYAAMLWLLPRALRRRVGAEMQATFEARLGEERGALRRAAALLHEVGGVVGMAVRTRVSARQVPVSAERGRLSMMDTVWQDVSIALRSLGRNPGYAAVAVVSLALGVGATSAVVSAMTSLLVDPLPVVRPEQLKVVYWRREAEITIHQVNSSGYRDPATGAAYSSNFSYPLYRALRDAHTGADVFAFSFLRNVSLAVDAEPPMVGGGLLADGYYFSALRPPLVIGRGFTDEDDRAAAPLVAVLSHGYWQRAFGGARNVLGRTVRVNGVPATVIGVTGPDFEGVSRGGFFPRTDVTVPLSAQPLVAARWGDGASLTTADGVFWLRVMARVSDGRVAADVTNSLATAFRNVNSPANEGDAAPASLLLAPGEQGPEAPAADSARLLWLLLGAVLLVLFIVCVNLASLMLARGVARERDIAVRRALGSGRGRILQHTLVEGFVLSVLGTALGLLLLVIGGNMLGTLLTNGLSQGTHSPVVVRPVLDWRVLAAAACACVFTTLVFSLVPALRLLSVDPGTLLKHRVAGSSGSRLALARLLVAIQIAVTVPLITGAVLLLRTVTNLNSVELGFDPNGLVMFRLDPGYTRLSEERYPELYRTTLERLTRIQGVESATLIENPLMSGIVSNSRLEYGDAEHPMYMNAVGPDFLRTMGMQLIAGRMPEAHEDASRPRVAALNRAAAQTVFGTESPIGSTVVMGGNEIQIVGLVSDSRYERQRSDVRPVLYDAALQRPGWGGHTVVLRTAEPLSRLEPEIRRVMRDIDADLPLPDLRTQRMQMERSLARERLFTQLLTGFGLFALLLASIGLHGVTAYAVSRRTSEIGVRIAFGARPGQVLWLVLRQVALLAGAGALIGVPAAIVAGPLLGSLLFGVAPTDMAVIAAAVTVMMVVAITAGLLPARAAAGLDPAVALRRDY